MFVLSGSSYNAHSPCENIHTSAKAKANKLKDKWVRQLRTFLRRSDPLVEGFKASFGRPIKITWGIIMMLLSVLVACARALMVIMSIWIADPETSLTYVVTCMSIVACLWLLASALAQTAYKFIRVEKLNTSKLDL